MAEGGVEEDNSEMLGPTLAPVLQTMHTPAPSNLSARDEESDCESSVGSPELASLDMGADTGTDLTIGSKQMHSRLEEANSSDTKMSPNASAAASHLNGTMAGLVTLQNLQNLASLQQSLPQVASLAAGLSNMANLSGNSAVNAPLNLSVSASAATPRSSQPSGLTDSPPSIMTTPLSTQQPPPAPAMQPPNPLMGSQQPAPMPQFILASGHLVQGIQGAQLLIPTSQGLATQTILTIPVNHVNSTDQMVNLALNNGQVMQTSLANLQAMAQSNLLNNHTNPVPPTSNGTINPNLLNPATLTHLLSNGSAQQLLQSIPQILNNPHANPNPPPLLNPLTQPLLSTTPNLLSTPTSQSTSQHRSQMNSSSHYVEPKLHAQALPRNPSPPNATGNPNRLANNGEISITTNHGPNSSQNMKRSPSSLSPNCTDSSTADLLIDSPNQPTINQTNSNVVDGINLDEIKDFAKAFKLRRLSLGLTQTQVGQALSVTEGPAYSQSAICSALASQMFAAAQLSTQQQAMFEKLDITPKSAQKIKPVLERWMKEAEDRYKSGQNHLTDFIGIEPSKKRKRRTSFTPQALELLNAHFERNTHPSGTEITGLAHQLGYEREVIRIWFCNKRQALKNTVRMMSKGMV
ncbi:POU domain, class 6, transcription factor 2 isoform X2 [Anoplophora glabripennis]|uniref:POU domain, class 6, transcription factor 2 isoform X2 n=1 Tax=Anoplophora glabripennis TaxID=217634 RepID=UPI000873C474|nr:POU domain, class 6, transcription factor 2 isoform X2 [Anoplophora glabripennis]